MVFFSVVSRTLPPEDQSHAIFTALLVCTAQLNQPGGLGYFNFSVGTGELPPKIYPGG